MSLLARALSSAKLPSKLPAVFGGVLYPPATSSSGSTQQAGPNPSSLSCAAQGITPSHLNSSPVTGPRAFSAPRFPSAAAAPGISVFQCAAPSPDTAHAQCSGCDKASSPVSASASSQLNNYVVKVREGGAACACVRAH